MKPYLVHQERAPDLSVLKTAAPEQLDSVLDSNQTGELQSMMEGVVTKGTGTGRRRSRASRSAARPAPPTPDRSMPTASYVNAPARVVHRLRARRDASQLQSRWSWRTRGSPATRATGGPAAAPLAKTVMEAYLADTRGR